VVVAVAVVEQTSSESMPIFQEQQKQGVSVDFGDYSRAFGRADESSFHYRQWK
jgi:hypothetical protein